MKKDKYVEAIIDRDGSKLTLGALSSCDGIGVEMERLNFLPGDEVAIVLLSDLTTLIANQRSVASADRCCGAARDHASHTSMHADSHDFYDGANTETAEADSP